MTEQARRNLFEMGMRDSGHSEAEVVMMSTALVLGKRAQEAQKPRVAPKYLNGTDWLIAAWEQGYDESASGMFSAEA